MTSSQNFKFNFDWRVTTLVVVLLPVLLSLGFWQLDRAEEKHQLQAEFAAKQARGPVPVEQLDPADDLRFQPVRLRGTFMPGKVIFLDNRIYRGQFGYEVVAPLLLASGDRVVLVNRGWVPGDKSRRHLPDITRVDGEVELTGDIYVPQGELLALSDEQVTGWPRVMQSIDVVGLAPEFTLPLFPYTVRLQAGSNAVLQPSWVVVNVQPAKHTGYAVQWFAMSTALVLIAVLANTNLWALITRRRQPEESGN